MNYEVLVPNKAFHIYLHIYKYFQIQVPAADLRDNQLILELRITPDRVNMSTLLTIFMIC